MDSILTTIKLMIGVGAECAHFDKQLIVHINRALMRLNQLGVGPAKIVKITSELETWSTLLGDDVDEIEAVKDYVYNEVKMKFDPPTSSFVLEAMKEDSNKLEWCLNVQAEMNEAEEG